HRMGNYGFQFPKLFLDGFELLLEIHDRVQKVFLFHLKPPHALVPWPIISLNEYSNVCSCSVKRIFNTRSNIFMPTTRPSPSGVETRVPTSGISFFAVSYSSFSYFRQHIKRPHNPEIFEGFSDKFWSFAILIDTGSKSPKNVEQHSIRPQGPMPPSIFASSRTPIWRNSMRVRKIEAKSFTRLRKSTRPSAVK